MSFKILKRGIQIITSCKINYIPLSAIQCVNFDMEKKLINIETHVKSNWIINSVDIEQYKKICSAINEEDIECDNEF